MTNHGILSLSCFLQHFKYFIKTKCSSESETTLGKLRFETFKIISYNKCDDFALQVLWYCELVVMNFYSISCSFKSKVLKQTLCMNQMKGFVDWHFLLPV